MNKILTSILITAAFIFSPALAATKGSVAVSHGPAPLAGSVNFGSS